MNRHFAQLHRDPVALTDAVSLFVETGLRRGNGVVCVAEPAHSDLVLTRVRDMDMDPGAFLKSGQLEVLDARATLAQVTVGDMPDWVEFRRVLGEVLDRVRLCGRGTTRVYGEMVNVLWRDGRAPAAIRMEEFWNELARVYQFSLFCSYMLDAHQDESYAGPLEEIGRTHSDILGTAEDERFRVALDSASRDVFGVPLSQMVGFSTQARDGERRFPSGQRTMLWVKRNLPSASAAVLERARRYYEESLH
ncbi:MAG: MEDS domain-containing protein [Gemmatimonadales bacterium]